MLPSNPAAPLQPLSVLRNNYTHIPHRVLGYRPEHKQLSATKMPIANVSFRPGG